MNVSVLKKKSLSFILFMPFFWWEILFIFCCFVPLCSTQAWRLAIVCVKFCNNIKRRYGRVNNNLFSVSFLPTFMCRAPDEWLPQWISRPRSKAINISGRPLMWLCDGLFHSSDPWTGWTFPSLFRLRLLLFAPVNPRWLIALRKMRRCPARTVDLLAPIC